MTSFKVCYEWFRKHPTYDYEKEPFEYGIRLEPLFSEQFNTRDEAIAFLEEHANLKEGVPEFVLLEVFKPQ